MTANKNKGLGKGLGALLSSVEITKEKGITFKPSDNEKPIDGNIIFIDITKIKQNPYQPRKEFDEQALDDLKNSIIEHGIIQPITVRRAVDGYDLISGERRLRASTKAGFDKIPAFIMDNVSDVAMLELALIENVQRENLNPIEIANGYQRLIEDCSLTQEQVATKVGKDRTTVTNFLRLLKLPEKIQDSVRAKDITMGHARALLALSDPMNIILAWNEIIEKSLSVRATESLVKNIEAGIIILGNDALKPKPEKIKKKEPKDNVSSDVAMILENKENELRHIFGTQVRINPKNEESGTIEFNFYSKDDFERLIELFNFIEKYNT